MVKVEGGAPCVVASRVEKLTQPYWNIQLSWVESDLFESDLFESDVLNRDALADLEIFSPIGKARGDNKVSARISNAREGEASDDINLCLVPFTPL